MWFLPPTNSADIVQKRQNMPNDMEVRRANTCNLDDFYKAGICPDHIVISNKQERFLDRGLREFLQTLSFENDLRDYIKTHTK